jgi:hypothetical protein
LPKCSARVELGRDAALASAVAADYVPDLRIRSRLRVPALSRTEVLAGAEVLARAAVLVGAGGVLGVGCSGMAGVAWPAEIGSGIVQTSGTAGPFPLRSMSALLWLAPASSVVPAPPVGAPESGASGWAPVSRGTSGARGSC